MKSATSFMLPSTVLSGTPILNTKCVGVIDHEGPEKNIATLIKTIKTHHVLKCICCKFSKHNSECTEIRCKTNYLQLIVNPLVFNK